MDTIEIMKELVADMTPTFNIQNNTEISAGCWKLENCSTFWLAEKQKITIDGEEYLIDSVKFGEYIIIKGTSQPAVDSFVIPAPHFSYGTHRNENAERKPKTDKTEITPFVYLMEPFEERKDNRWDSPIDRRSDLRVFFLETYDKKGDSLRETIEEKNIKPMGAMADYMEKLINEQENKFDTVDFFRRFKWHKLGVPEVWGNKKPVFDEPLAGVELRFTLPIVKDLSCKKHCIGR